ncbi:MAG: tRNA guanosine(34) transglycosylase Tgt [Sphingobacteriia bacterium]|nr:tRNA guanosine(34) transglycosylase Tgt [Sphingobacteriia bacterium]
MFDLLLTDSQSSARAGVLHTAHGDIPTPIFMPVGTQGTIKATDHQRLVTDLKAPIILGNTYHLYLRPGTEVLSSAGGLHPFMQWPNALLTDSGGYQVFSLSHQRKLTEAGVTFQSHIDGSKHLFTPESVVDTQRIIGSDIQMMLDECTPWPCEFAYADTSLQLTHRWAIRGIQRFKETEPLYGFPQHLFPIVQGSTFPDLRTQSAEFIANLGAEGNAIGGLSVGEPDEELYAMTALVCNILPKDKPRYLMGVGTPANILEGIALGVDMFDCVMPTRNARHGILFTWEGIRNIRNARYKSDFSPLDPQSTLKEDQIYSYAYLRHLFVAEETLALQIATLHNLNFYLSLVREARIRILEGTFVNWKNKVIPALSTRI